MSKVPFKVSARAARLIGRENVSNAEGAVIELVKNGYDADANLSLVFFDNKYFEPPEEIPSGEFQKLKNSLDINSEIYPLLGSSYTKNSTSYVLNESVSEDKWQGLTAFFKSQCSIYIIDSGCGMSDDTINEYWMTIGTDNKETNSKSEQGRIKTGAKGIGRFALDRLGDKCEMITKTIFGDYCEIASKKNIEVEGSIWKVDWDQFEGHEKPINDVSAELINTAGINISKYLEDLLPEFTQKNEIISILKYNSGTILKITGLRDDWTDTAIEKIFLSLETLAPPSEDDSYKIFVLSTLHKNKYGEVKPPILDDYDYKLYAKYNKNHRVDITIYRNELSFNKIDNDIFTLDRMKPDQYQPKTFIDGIFSYSKQIEELLPSLSENFKKYRLDSIGEFDFTFYFGKLGEGPEEF